MDVGFPSDGTLAYSRAQAWQEAPVRLQQGARQDVAAREIGGGEAGAVAFKGKTECQTCKSRKYQDSSSDPTVSFQTPTALSPQAAETAVRAHEQEHVAHEQVNAAEEGRRVVSQQVAIHYAICPDCGRAYVSGGTTTTVTKQSGSAGYGGSSGSASAVGMFVDTRV